MKATLKITNSADAPDTGEVLIYGAIGDDYDGISAKRFIDELAAAEKERGSPYKALDVRINSTGGYVQDGFAIYNALKSHPAQVTTVVDAFALSAASTIAMAGDNIRMHESGVMMIHKPQGFAFGDAATMRKESEILDLLQKQIAGIYASRTFQSLDKLNEMIDAETWMTAEEATKLGFADEVIPNAPPTENPDPDAEPDPEPFGNLRAYRNIPAWLMDRFRNQAIRKAGAAWRRNLLRRRLELQEAELAGER